MWRAELFAEPVSSYSPLEHASAALDPTRGRLYAGSSAGRLAAFDTAGRRVWWRDSVPMAGEIALDIGRGEMCFGTQHGAIECRSSVNGDPIWSQNIASLVRARPSLDETAVYVAGENDEVVALSRSDGAVRWRYTREGPDGLSSLGHSGVVLATSDTGQAMALVGFGDGTVVALSRTDGTLLWEAPIASDETLVPPAFPDVDANPLVRRALSADGTPAGSEVWVASMGGGLAVLSLLDGSVTFRDEELTEIMQMIEVDQSKLVAVRALDTVLLDAATREVLWRKRPASGGFSGAAFDGGVVYVAEGRGGFVALDVRTGEELARVHSGHGFTAPPVARGGVAAAVSNGGALYVLHSNRI